MLECEVKREQRLAALKSLIQLLHLIIHQPMRVRESTALQNECNIWVCSLQYTWKKHVFLASEGIQASDLTYQNNNAVSFLILKHHHHCHNNTTDRCHKK